MSDTFEDARRRARDLITDAQTALRDAPPGTTEQARYTRNTLSYLAAAQAALQQAETFGALTTVLT